MILLHLLPPCHQVPYSLHGGAPPVLRLGHSDILILWCHGVYEVVYDVFFTSQRDSLLCVYLLFYSTRVHVLDGFNVPYFVLYY